MPGVTRVPRIELNGLQGRLLKLVVRRKIGHVPENVEVMWNHPAVFKYLMRMGDKAEKWDRLDAGLASLAVMATAASTASRGVVLRRDARRIQRAEVGAPRRGRTRKIRL